MRTLGDDWSRSVCLPRKRARQRVPIDRALKNEHFSLAADERPCRNDALRRQHDKEFDAKVLVLVDHDVVEGIFKVFNVKVDEGVRDDIIATYSGNG